MNLDNPKLPTRGKELIHGQNKVSTYETSGGTVTAAFARHNLSLIPPISEGSVIHDNASGAGTVTRAILDTTKNVNIYATDTDQVFLEALQADSTANSWPVKISNERCEALPFEDNFFDYSITNMGIFFTSSGGLDGAKEVYRTLKPGGTATVNCWESVTWFFPLKTVHDALRPGKPYLAPPINWHDGKQIQKIMAEVGFKDLKVSTSEAWATIPEEGFKDWAEKTWTYLGGAGIWQESDEERWDEAVKMLMEILKKQPGTRVVDGNVEMRASQWVVVCTK